MQEYENLIKSESFRFFSKYYLIDVFEDKVLIFNNNDLLQQEKILSFFKFMQEETEKLKESMVDIYFSNLNTSNIEKNGGSIVFDVEFKENDIFKKYIAISSIVSNTDNKKVLVAFKECSISSSKDEMVSTDRLSTISSMVSDTILKIYNALDTSNDIVSTRNYITTLLDVLINDLPEFNKEFKKDIKLQVNKVKNTLLVADDDLITRNLIKKTFSDEFDITFAQNGQEAIEIFERVGIDNIVGMFLDLMMPVVDGFQVLEYLRKKNILYKVPIIIISGAEDKETRQKVYQYNIADLLEKPFNLEVIKYRTRNLIKLYKTSNALNNMVMAQYTDLNKILTELVNSYKYDNKKKIDLVKRYAAIIINEVKTNLTEYKITDYIESKIIDSVDLYDVGYYIIPRTIGHTTITDEENNLIKNYPKFSKAINERFLSKYRDDDLLKYGCEIALYCHENYDGSGFPDNVKGDDIPISAQIVSMAIYLEKLFRHVEIQNNNSQNIIGTYFNNTIFNPKLVNLLPQILNKIGTLNE